VGRPGRPRVPRHPDAHRGRPLRPDGQGGVHPDGATRPLRGLGAGQSGGPPAVRVVGPAAGGAPALRRVGAEVLARLHGEEAGGRDAAGQGGGDGGEGGGRRGGGGRGGGASPAGGRAAAQPEDGEGLRVALRGGRGVAAGRDGQDQGRGERRADRETPGASGAPCLAALRAGSRSPRPRARPPAESPPHHRPATAASPTRPRRRSCPRRSGASLSPASSPGRPRC